MIADPQTITLTGHGSPVLYRVPSPNPGKIGLFRNADGLLELSFHQNSTAGRFDRQIRLTQKKIAADPITAVNKEISASVVVTVNEPKYGFTDTELDNLFGCLIFEIQESTSAKLYALLRGEN